MLNIKLNYHVTFRSIVRLSRVSNTCLMSEISYFSMAKLSVAQQEKHSRTFKDFYCFSRTSIAFQGHSRPGILFFKFNDFPGFSRTVETMFLALYIHNLKRMIF